MNSLLTAKKRQQSSTYFLQISAKSFATVILSPFQYFTNTRLDNIYIQEDKILSLIRNINPHKSNGPDLITGEMLRMFDNSIVLQLLNNYRPISLLPLCGKIFEKIIFEKLYS